MEQWRTDFNAAMGAANAAYAAGNYALAVSYSNKAAGLAGTTPAATAAVNLRQQAYTANGPGIQASQANGPGIQASQANAGNNLPASGGGSMGGGGVSAETTAARNNVMETVKGMFTSWGLGSLANIIIGYAEKDYSGESIAFMLRNTPEYKQRFPAMEALSKKGRGYSEAEYIGYETYAAQLETRFGMPRGILMNNITTLLTGDVSADELLERVTLAASDSLTAPQDLRNQMKSYYNVDSGALTAYYLDPSIAMPILERQSATARIGVEATRQKVNTSLAMATELLNKGVTETEARKGFANVASAKEFEAGKGETITQDNLTRGVFGDAAQGDVINRIAGSRTGRFQGGGSFTGTQTGMTGIGSSST